MLREDAGRVCDWDGGVDRRREAVGNDEGVARDVARERGLAPRLGGGLRRSEPGKEFF